MDRFEEMQYQIATEVSAGLITGGVIAGLIGVAVAKARVSSKINESRKKKYDREKAAGSVSEKTMRNANKVNVGGVPYPKYAEIRDAVAQVSPQIAQIAEQCQKNAVAEINRLCNSKPDFKPLSDIVNVVDNDASDVTYAITSDIPQFPLGLFTVIDLNEVKEVLEAAVQDGETDTPDDYDQLKYVAGDMDIETLKQAGTKILEMVIPKIYQICDKYTNECAQKINAIKGIRTRATKNISNNPDDVYREYNIIFTKWSD